MSQYTYSASQDTANGVVNLNSLNDEIHEAPFSTYSHSSLAGDVLDIYFTSDLTTQEQADLTALVAAHTGEKRRALKVVELRVGAVNPRRFFFLADLAVADLPLDYADEVIEIL